MPSIFNLKNTSPISSGQITFILQVGKSSSVAGRQSPQEPLTKISFKDRGRAYLESNYCIAGANVSLSWRDSPLFWNRKFAQAASVVFVSVSKHHALARAVRIKCKRKKKRFQTHHLLSFPNLTNLCEVWREQMSAFWISHPAFSLRGSFQRLFYS